MDVLVNEVLYDPDGADGGYEFVELAAVAGAPADLSLEGWVVETGNGSTGEWKVAWTGRAVDRLVHGLFVVGESGVEPRPQFVAELDLQNGPDACRLRSPLGEVDVVGWGEPLPAGFSEGAAVEDVSAKSLARFPDAVDTNDNARDFREAPPSPNDFNAPASLVLLEDLELPPPDLPVDTEWTFRATLRNAGRQPWSGAVSVRCALHPQETLAAFVVDAVDPLPPGASRTRATSARPPPGTHLPIADSGGEESASRWRGVGEDLFVSEALSHPRPDEPEWIEIAGSSGASIDLAALELRDAAGSGGRLNGLLRAGEFVVVTEDTSRFRAVWRTPADARIVLLAPWPALNHTGSEDEAVERVELRVRGSTSAAPWILASAALPGGADDGVSWERISRVLPGDAPQSYAPSLDASGGTPGRENSRPADRAIVERTGALVVQPRAFHPARDGGALVVLRTERAATSCTLRIHDAAGRRIASLAPWSLGGSEWRAVWDGRTSEGEDAPIGLYVVCAQAPGVVTQRVSVALTR